MKNAYLPLALLLLLPAVLPLAACGGGDAEPVTEGETAGAVDLDREAAPDDPALGNRTDATGNVTANETMDAIRDAGGLAGLSPNEAVANLDEWIVKLGGVDGGEALVGQLRRLKTALTDGELDGTRIGGLLQEIGAETRRLAGGNQAVGGLGAALESAGEQMTAQ